LGLNSLHFNQRLEVAFILLAEASGFADFVVVHHRHGLLFIQVESLHQFALTVQHQVVHVLFEIESASKGFVPQNQVESRVGVVLLVFAHQGCEALCIESQGGLIGALGLLQRLEQFEIQLDQRDGRHQVLRAQPKRGVRPRPVGLLERQKLTVHIVVCDFFYQLLVNLLRFLEVLG